MIDEIYQIVEEKYFSSGDFNGTPIYSLAAEFDIESDEFRHAIRSAIEDDVLTVRFEGNPHILEFSGIPKERILEGFDSADYPGHTCLYPSKVKLDSCVKLEDYRQAPYELKLAQGAGQLDYRAFDLSVLEFYKNDPRYHYSTDFIHGQISITDEYFESDSVPDHDQVILQTFGFGYDDNLNRYVTVFIRYLADLSPEHQRVWEAKEVSGTVKLHPDYYASSILGSWGTRMSIFSAFTKELEVINEMSKIMGRPALFRNTYDADTPKEFGFLLRPTQSEFNGFMLLLDKMMSDNINIRFFGNDVQLESEEIRDDGKIIVKPKGTIQVLTAWVKKYFHPEETSPIDEMIATFKEVRKLRQKPAHTIDADKFDQDLFRRQREIVIKAYDAVRTLRLILANHPKVKASPPKINEWLFEGNIWDR
ncbi:AAA family ATPase [Pseudomonas aeruginosa]|uniref:AAA family ATPase n=1 Tax=Pseudomonas aeruginosa TaxID=287 RepID=UPI000D6EB6DF|nr:AAA family ATPase [Pseudomonas aeruginosa]PWU35910.1 AAA family ATPase [Pseudomonas aeruginosa]